MKNPKEKANDIFDINYSLATELNPMASIEIRKIYALKISVKSVDEIIASKPSAPISAENGSLVFDIELSSKWWKQVFKELNKRLHKSIGRR
jgi:hypothetical protein